MNRTKLFVKNSIFTILLQIISMISSIILPIVIINNYSSEINGLISSITQFLLYLKLIEAGLASSAIYSLYKPLAEKDYNKINSIVSASHKFYRKTALYFTIAVFIFSILYSFIVKTSLSQIEIILLVFIMGLSGTLEFLTLSKYRVLLNADQKVYVISIASILYDILNVIIVVVLSILKVNLVLLKFVALFAVLIRTLILSIYVRKKYKYLDYNAEPDNTALNKRWDALYLQILGIAQVGIPVVYLTIFSDNLSIVSIYSVYYMVVGGINNLLGLFSNTLYSSFGELIVTNKKETFNKAVHDFEYVYYLLITIVFSITFIMIMPFVRLYTLNVTDVNYYYPLVGILSVLNALLYNLKTPQGMLVISAGHYKETRIQTTIQALLIIVLGIPLTMKFGIIGILIASIISNLYRVIDLIIYVPKKIGGCTSKNTLLNFIKLIIYSAIICLPFIFYKISINSYFEFIYYCIFIGIYSSVVILVGESIFFKKELKEILKRLKQIFRRK